MLVMSLLTMPFIYTYSQTYLKVGVGMGTYGVYKNYADRSTPIQIQGEVARFVPGVGNGFYLSYSSYIDDASDEIIGLSVGASTTFYLAEIWKSSTESELPFSLGGRLNPYVSFLVGLNLGAGFNENVIGVNNGELRIYAIRVPIGLIFHPTKNIGIYLEAFAPQSNISTGLMLRLGTSS